MGTRADARLPFASISPDFLKPRDPVLGYIKIGGKESTPRFARATGRPWLAPVRYVNPPRFEVTTREKIVQSVEGTGNAKGKRFSLDYGYKRDVGYHEAIEEEAPTSLRVRLMYPTPAENVVSFLGAYGSGAWACRGDGVEAIDAKRGACVCPCPRLKQFDGTYEGDQPRDSLQCRPHGQLNVLLQDADVFGGFWVFKTTSYESISNILHVLQTMEGIFGRVDGLPFELRVMAATKSFGEGMTTQPIVTLVLAASMDMARSIAADAAAESQRYLPVSVPEAVAYREAVVEEMETEAESTATEFSDEATLEARAEEAEPLEPEDDEGPDFEVVPEGEELEMESEADAEGPEEPAEEADPAKVESPASTPKGGKREPQPEEARSPSPAPPEDSRESSREDKKSGAGEVGRGAVADTPEGSPAGPARSEEPARPVPPSEPTELQVLEQLCRDVLNEVGYDQEAIDGRVGYHKAKNELEKLRAGLEAHCADAYAKVTTPALDLEAGPPDDGLDIP